MEEHTTDLADIRDGHAERFVPELMGGLLIDAEHRGRYWWAASLVAGARVLDAGCGTGYGAVILARAGAREVVGVDRAAHVIEAVRSDADPGIVFEVGDLLELPFPDGSFDVAVCFEAIEHVDEPDAALDELARVLTVDGVLAISSPNQDVYVQGNPHHRHEYVPDELASALRTRFANVRLVRQHDWLAAAIFEDDAFAAGDGAPIEEAAVRKVKPGEPGHEQYTLALASNAPLPALPAVVVLTDDIEIRRLVERAAALGEAQQQLAATQQQVTALVQEGEERQQVIANLETEARKAQHASADAHERLRELDVTVAAEQAARARAEEELRAITQTKTFRVAATLGGAYGRIRGIARRRS